jgi:hypothetical protein
MISRTMRLCLVLALICLWGNVAYALPPPEDVPEEVLRLEIITIARSPVDNSPLTAAQYAELQEQLRTSPYPPELSGEVQNVVFLLRLLKFFRTLLPFL